LLSQSNSFIKPSSEIRHAAEKEGKYPQRLSGRNLDEASERKLASNKYLSSHETFKRPKKDRIDHSVAFPVDEDSPIAPSITDKEGSNKS